MFVVPEEEVGAGGVIEFGPGQRLGLHRPT